MRGCPTQDRQWGHKLENLRRIVMVSAPLPWRLAMVPPERRGESVRRGVPGEVGYLTEAEITATQVVSGESHAPIGQVLHWRLTKGRSECSRECGP